MKAIIFLLVFATSVFALGECNFNSHLVMLDSDKAPKWAQFSCVEDDGTYVEIAFEKDLSKIVKAVRPSDAVGWERTLTGYKLNKETAETFMAEIEYDDLGVIKSERVDRLDASIIRDVYNSIRNEFKFPVR